MTSTDQGGGVVKSRHRMTMVDLCETYSVSHECELKYLRRENDPLPAMRFGRRWLFDPQRVERWLERQARRQVNQARRAR